MDNWERLILYKKKLVLPRIYQLVDWFAWIACFAAVLFIAAIVYRYGFTVTDDVHSALHFVSNFVWVIFLINTTLSHLFSNDEGSKFTVWTWLLDIGLYLTLLPVVFHLPEPGNAAYWIWIFFHSSYYKGAILLLMSFTLLSGFFVRLLGRKTNPSLILASSFFIIILVGAGLLMLPRATYNGISWIDALFISTSATCVTGLVSVDVPSTFTMEGQIIIMLLIQIGGLGVMTITSFFAMFFMGNTSLYNQLAVGDMISTNSLNSLLSTLLYILGFTLAIEGIGMLLIWLDIHGTLGMTFYEELYFSAFHSISAFCNAGFSTLPGGMGNEMVMHNHNFLYIVLSLLIVFGGIGFPILVNMKDTIFYYLRYMWAKIFFRRRRFKKQIHLYNLNTKIVLFMTGVLLLAGTLVILLFEWNNAFAGMTGADKVVHAFFNSVCPRTAGFASVGLTTLSTQTLLLMIILMMIGGGTQSTAGGVKINVFAVILINLFAVLRGVDRTYILHREISSDSVKRSNAALILYLLIVFIGIFVMTIIEPQASVMALVFECVSALSTVGSSLDLTPELSNAGKLVIIVLMFVGRVGAFTLVSGLIRQEKKKNYKYPSDNIIIN
ncbi:TrkH family potassium uptake protein [Bacteroides caecigallinarum]|uniref:TrkH family potassium uptake protein n=1 Tax=Bacteroides caecigallinarum TaxID=1411144 RepID=UPI001F2E225D|nr:potassium transporter TrkG [Bacteroides caecigallinarum]MCF2582944.1 potassium transporter [Bacteroides caecigallinarum]